MPYDPDLVPILDGMTAQLAALSARLDRLEAAPVPAPVPVSPAGGFRRLDGFRLDRALAYPWGKADIYLPAWATGPKTMGDPALLDWQADGSVIVNARRGAPSAKDASRSWYSGVMQGQGVLRHARGRIGADIHVTDPGAVAAMFGHAPNAKEVDFELTFLNGQAGWSPAVHMPRAGGGRASSSRRVMRRAPLSGKMQRLEYDLRPDRCDFYCDGEIFETIWPEDMADGATWDSTTGMDLFFSIEEHDAWAGWTYASGKAQMRVHAIAPGAAWIETPAKAPLPRPSQGTAVDPAPRTIHGGAWTFTQGTGSRAGVAADGETVVMAKGAGESSARATFPVTPGVPHRASFSVQGYLSVTGAGKGWAGLSTGNHVRDFTPARDSETITLSASRPSDSLVTGLRIAPIPA